jgi:hypothetical protein
MYPSSSTLRGRHGQNVFDRVTQSFHNARLSNSKKGVRMLSVATCLIAASITARAQDCSIVVDGTDQAAIQSALDAAVGPCVVIIPPGRYQIEGTLLFRDDDITLMGSGADNTVLFRETDGTTTSMVRAVERQRVRVSGIRFEGVLGPDSNGREVGVLLENAGSFRVDHSSFAHLGFAGVRTNGSSSGVVDHCDFEDLFKPVVNTDGYGVVVFGTDQLTGIPFGSDQATFIEDSTFSRCRHAVAANKAARYVFRFNYVTQNVVAHAIDAHGTEDGSQVGTEWIDAHDNVADAPVYNGYPVRIRGGAGLIWNNRFEGYMQVGVELTQYTTEITGPVYVWNNTIIPDTTPLVRARCLPLPCDPPVYFLEPPPDYTPYPYPHPLAMP